MATPSVSMITNVIQSWEQVKLTPEVEQVVGQLVFGKFFELAPSAMDFYPFFCASQEELFNDPSFRAHSMKVIQTLDYVITSLMDIDRNVLINLGFRHSKYPGVSPEVFHPLGKALIYALKTSLASNWHPALEGAWTNVIDFLAENMTEGMLKGSNAKATVRHRLQLLSLESEPVHTIKESPMRSVSPTESDSSSCQESQSSDGLSNEEKLVIPSMPSQRTNSARISGEISSKPHADYAARPFELQEHEIDMLKLSWEAFNSKNQIVRFQNKVHKRYKVGRDEGKRRGVCFFAPSLGPKCQAASMIGKLIVHFSAEAVGTVVEMGKKHFTHYSTSDDLMRDLPIFGEILLAVLKEELEKKSLWSVEVHLVWNKFVNGLIQSMMSGAQRGSTKFTNVPKTLAQAT